MFINNLPSAAVDSYAQDLMGKNGPDFSNPISFASEIVKAGIIK